jgi:AraC-like DNA-binding protein
MDFQQAFLSALQSNTLLTKTFSIKDYLPEAIVVPENIENNLPHIQAYGNIHSVYPYYYEISNLDSYCLLFTESGSGSLVIGDDSYILDSGTLAIMNCKDKHKIAIHQSPWNFKIIFINGNMIPFLYSTIATTNGNIYAYSPGSDIPDLMQKLFKQLVKNSDKSFLLSKFIINILLEIIMEIDKLKETDNSLPEYLNNIKISFDSYYQNNYTLAALEQEYHVSKYRICRDFTEHFNISPIQYLNQKRIQIAKEALLTSDKRINEIGRMVGIENTNNFIRLFKKITGVTPLDFRKQPPADTSF